MKIRNPSRHERLKTALAALAGHVGVPANDYQAPWGLVLDSAYGGWRVEQNSPGGGQMAPFGETRHSPSQLERMIWFAVASYRAKPTLDKEQK